MSRILVVEDDSAIRHMEERILSSAGHEVVEAADVSSARAVLDTRPPDLVVLDLMMPGGSGLDLARQMRATPNLAEIPVVVVSARARAEDMRQGFEAGATHYLAKPFTRQKLLEIVALALEDR